jgi:hypothetical protein
VSTQEERDELLDAAVDADLDAEMDALGYNDPGYDYADADDPRYPYDQGYDQALIDSYDDEADILLYVPVTFRGAVTITVAALVALFALIVVHGPVACQGCIRHLG